MANGHHSSRLLEYDVSLERAFSPSPQCVVLPRDPNGTWVRIAHVEGVASETPGDRVRVGASMPTSVSPVCGITVSSR